jgi:predicted ATPase
MKICRIYIKDFEQFQDLELDFTNPATGDAVDKICFIGSNGTGKSKILRLINWFFYSALPSLVQPNRHPNLGDNPESKLIFTIASKGVHFLLFYFQRQVVIFNLSKISKGKDAILIKELLALKAISQVINIEGYKTLIESTKHGDLLNELVLSDNSKDLLIYSPDESKTNSYSDINDVPKTSVSDALALFKNTPFFAQVSPDTVDVFWKLLVYNLKKRDEERERFERRSENLIKTKAQLIDEFDKANPKILDSIAKIWDKILAKAGLEFDAAGANNPVQLTDNLKAYIKIKNKDQVIPYRELSTGIRNFIFRVGHIHSLFFNRQIDRGFILIDEPENGLFPNFLFELMETYEEIADDKSNRNNIQMFFATHNPIIAAQFEPYERIILDWKEDGSVEAKRGIAPIGDDPNDILSNDFELTTLMGPEGRKMWDRYQDLKKKLIRESDKLKKEEFINEINQIGSLYNFS